MNVKQPDPDSLKRFLAQPDETTFGPLYESSRGLVYTLCLRRLGNPSDAQDAFQGVYFRLLGLARKGATPDVPLDRLVSRLSMREADRLRKQKIRRERKERAVARMSSAAPGMEQTGADPEQERLREELERLVAGLPEKLRLPTQLHYFHGLTHRQIAEALDEPASTVSYRIQKALERLQPASRRAGLAPLAARLASIASLATLLEPRISAASVFESISGRGPVPGSSRGPSARTSRSGPLKPGVVIPSVVGAALVILALILFLNPEAPESPDGSLARGSDPTPGPASSSLPSETPPAPGDLPDATPPRIEPASLRLDLRAIWAHDESPVADATIELRDGEADESEPPAAPGLDTGADGRATLVLDPGETPSWTLQVTHPEARPLEKTLARRGEQLLLDGEELSTDEPLILTLTAENLIVGTVRDSITGEGIAGARVSRRRIRDLDLLAKTDEKGEFRFTADGPESLEIVADSDHHASKLTAIKPGEDGIQYLHISLDPETTFTVEVLDSERRPVEGAKVLPSRLGCDGCYDGDRFELTDESGLAVIEDVSRLNPTNLRIEKSGYKSGSAPAPGPSKKPFRATVVLEDESIFLYEITGTIRDPSGSPIPGIKVEYKDGHGTTYSSKAKYGQHFAVSDDSGRYHLEFEDDFGYCHLGVGGKGWAPQVHPRVAAGVRGSPVMMDFVLEPAHWLEGTVVDEAGEPLANVEVSAMPDIHILNEGIAYPAVYRKTKTGKDGRFRLDDLAGPTCAIRLRRKKDRQRPSRDLPSVEVDQEVTLELPQWGVIQGRVLDAASGAPVTEFNIKLRGSVWVRRADPGEAFSSDDGSFVLESLEQHEKFGIVVEADGFLATHIPDLSPRTLERGEPVVVKLRRGHRLEVRVVHAETGEAVPEARVISGEPIHASITPEQLNRDLSILKNVLTNLQIKITDPAGKTVLTHGGSGVILLDAAGFQDHHVLLKDLPGAASREGFAEIPLEAGVSVRGTVTLGGKGAASEVLILKHASPVSPPTRPSGDQLYRGKSDAGGTFLIDGVAPGEYALELKLAGGRGFQAVHYRRVLTVGNEGVEGLEIGKGTGSHTLHGTLLEPDGSTPLSATLRLRPRERGEFAEIRTHVSSFAKSSRYSMPHLPEGIYDVEAIAIRDREWKVLSLGEIHLTGDQEQDFTLP